MSESPAARAQVAAATPALSTWLSANAGSGKTRVLTDRVARLLLGGTQPQNILCLTYTKAAATEMQNRLFARLGAWAMTPDDALRKDLTALGEARAGGGGENADGEKGDGPNTDGANADRPNSDGKNAGEKNADEKNAGGALTQDALSPERLALARQLFARAIEAPGGLRILTIHSFCATLLRRYPLEAGVSPGFREMDERTTQQLRDEVLQDMADRRAPEAFEALAALDTAHDPATFLGMICANAESFEAPLTPKEALARFGLAPSETLPGLLGEVFLGEESALLSKLAQILAHGSSTDQKHAARLRPLLFKAADQFTLRELEAIFLTGAGAKAPFSAKINSYSSKATRGAMGDDMEALNALMARIEEARPRRLGLIAAEQALTLSAFARAFLPAYEERKADRGLLDFDDLIRRASRLLHDPALAAWVLFRLDGGIDHILVDEAQDTAPRQWQVIARLTDEFTAGDGAREGQRTLFVVGDKKQSIYSFQGADLTAFDARRDAFRLSFAQAQAPMQDCALDYSFRSAPAILDLVDASFRETFSPALGDAPPHHLAHHVQMPGRVELWPLVPKAETSAEEDGWDPVDLIFEDHHSVLLAQQIADEIAAIINANTQIVERGQERPVHAGDFLILVQRRAELFEHIIRACKQRDLPISGADRLKLGEEMAIKDLKALLAFLATPEDSLALACALRSPLFGWSEEDIYHLAYGRKTPHLWEALRSAEAPRTLEILFDLQKNIDFLRPYELIERILIHHNGRARLLTRLGVEAEDAIDELLNQALIYEQNDVPSLTGFLVWLEGDEVEVKRALGGEGRSIRVMTVHGAKGLEANIVILPDTADRRARTQNGPIMLDDGFVAWGGRSEARPPPLVAAYDLAHAKARQESVRLLYVALTRARTWLIVAGAGTAKTETKSGPIPRDEQCWYRQVEAGMDALGAPETPHGRRVHASGIWPLPAASKPDEAQGITLPEWAARPAPECAREAAPRTPSGLGGAKILTKEEAAQVLHDNVSSRDNTPPGDEGKDGVRGTLLHRLLELMPLRPRPEWPGLAAAIIPDGYDRAALLAEAARVLDTPELAPLFAPDALAEVSLCAPWNGHRLEGTIDRLIVTPTRVLAVDFKSNHLVPRRAADVPEGLLRQMGAYAHMLGDIYPDRRIETAILWTANAQLMPLEQNAVGAALARAGLAPHVEGAARADAVILTPEP